MIVALTLGIFIPLAFWLFDTLVKVLGSISTDDIGADLCLFGVSFNVTTLLISSISSELRTGNGNENSVKQLVAIASLALMISLIFYVFSLLLIAPSRRKSYPNFIRSLRANPNKVTITVIIGFAMVLTQTIIYVLHF